jgi:hypothetical protein
MTKWRGRIISGGDFLQAFGQRLIQEENGPTLSKPETVGRPPIAQSTVRIKISYDCRDLVGFSLVMDSKFVGNRAQRAHEPLSVDVETQDVVKGERGRVLSRDH